MASPLNCFTQTCCGRRQHCRRLTGNCCCRMPSCPMPTRWRAVPCRSSAEEMTRLLTPEPIDVAAALDAAIGSPDPGGGDRSAGADDADLPAAAPGFAGCKTATTPLARDQGKSRTRTLAAAAAAGGPRLGQRAPTGGWCCTATISRFSPRGSLSAWTRDAIRARSSRPRSTDSGSTHPGTSRRTSPEEILPKVRHDPTYLARHNMVMLPDGGLQQRGEATRRSDS